MTDQRYPLHWPEGRPRTPPHRRESARFDTTFARARDEVVRQIELMCGYSWQLKETALIISTNLALRNDGLPLASQRKIDDPGVAVYFNYKKRPMCFACDRWDRIEDNMQAIAKTIDALRGIARWGTGDMLEAAFTGFTALPSPSTGDNRSWRSWLMFEEHARPSWEEVERAYRTIAAKAHPDRGGNDQWMAALNNARDQARKELGR